MAMTSYYYYQFLSSSLLISQLFVKALFEGTLQSFTSTNILNYAPF